MEESELSDSSYQFDHDLMLPYYLESFAESVYTSNNSDSGGIGIAEPYLYEAKVEYPLTPPVDSDDDDGLHNSNWINKRFYYFNILRVILSMAACSSQVAYQIGDEGCKLYAVTQVWAL